jgi:Holliday junction resolvase RusA-like endonuclease
VRLTGFTVPGRPRGKERARVAPGQQRPYTPAQTVRAEKELAELYLQAADERRPLTGPVRLDIVAVFQIPRDFSGPLLDAANSGLVPCMNKPDRDNIEKLVCDALNGLAWADDAQIVAGETVKRYGNPARTEVRVEELIVAGIPAIPAQTRREARMDAPPRPKRRRPLVVNRVKSKLPKALQAAVDRALGKERPR